MAGAFSGTVVPIFRNRPDPGIAVPLQLVDADGFTFRRVKGDTVRVGLHGPLTRVVCNVDRLRTALFDQIQHDVWALSTWGSISTPMLTAALPESIRRFLTGPDLNIRHGRDLAEHYPDFIEYRLKHGDVTDAAKDYSEAKIIENDIIDCIWCGATDISEVHLRPVRVSNTPVLFTSRSGEKAVEFLVRVYGPKESRPRLTLSDLHSRDRKLWKALRDWADYGNDLEPFIDRGKTAPGRKAAPEPDSANFDLSDPAQLREYKGLKRKAQTRARVRQFRSRQKQPTP